MDILIAEDNLIFRTILVGLCESWGYRVFPVSDGVSALETLMGKDPPHLAILDLHMPRMDGLEICKRVRSRKDASCLYLLLMTGSTEEAKLNEALEAGADDFITKPFEPEDLRAKLLAGSRNMSV